MQEGIPELYRVPAWVAVLFGIMTPISFTTNGVLVKHLTTKSKFPFEPTNLSFTAYVMANLIVLCGAIAYWSLIEFSTYLFIVGIIGSIINTIGLVSLGNAFSMGPAGPISAIAAISNLLLVIIEAIKLRKVPSNLELIGFICGAYGAFILVLPNIFEKFCFCCCIKKKPNWQL